MALTDILTYEGAMAIQEEARGDIGVLVDVQGGKLNEITLPTLGGSCTYPSEDDVQDGVTFGDVYTGNLVVPAEADVETGVQYGANGTEFTGALVGGGGGVFIVNE